MTEIDPKTRHMTRQELSQVLDQLQTAGGKCDESEEKTRLWQRRQSVEVRDPLPTFRTTEPVTELELVQRAPTKPSLASASAEIQTRKVSRLTIPLRRWVVRVALLLPAATGAVWVGLHLLPRPEPTAPVPSRRNAAALVVAPKAKAAKAAPTEQSLPSRLPAPSEQSAVDQLISGHLHAAMDSYRALAQAHADQPAFAFVAAQLERELNACAPGDAPCAR